MFGTCAKVKWVITGREKEKGKIFPVAIRSIRYSLLCHEKVVWR